MRGNLTEDEIKAVLARAEELHFGGTDSDIVLRSAEEAGLPRSVVEQALRERFQSFDAPPGPGDVVFARSSDGRHYIGEVATVDGDRYRVRFLKGGEADFDIGALKPCAMLPGEKVTANWPGWGWWRVTVVGYDAPSRTVTVSDGWNEMRLPLTEVRLDPPKQRRNGRRAVAWAYVAIATFGGLLGALATWLVLR